MSNAIYNTIGKGYNNTRRADPYIAGRMLALLQPSPNGRYLDVGCGTANYTHYMAQAGFTFYGIDPSDTMLDIAHIKEIGGTFTKATAESIPFDDAFFDGTTAMLTLHHWPDKLKGIREVHRVLKPGSKIVFFSFTEAQMEGYWLAHYFPEMVKRSGEMIPTETEMIDLLNEAGFSSVQTEKYFVQPDLQDHFLYAHKYRPEQYLDEDVRKGTSGFVLCCTPQEIERGIKALKNDIQSGHIQYIISKYENANGDYLFYHAVK
jgi:ubiquinone/menaquinone biosynthesis C-methylase UbiE